MSIRDMLSPEALAKLGATTTTPTIEPSKCEGCGKTIRTGNLYCGDCDAAGQAYVQELRK